MRLRSVTLLSVLLAVLGPGVRAEGEEKTTVDLVLEAVASGSRARLAAVAAPPEVDPWAVVDDLHAAGRPEAARAFAEAYAGADREALARFATEAPPRNEEVRDVLRGAEAAVLGGGWEEALQALREAAPPEGAVLAMRVAALEGRLLAELGRFEEAREPYARAGELAGQIGRDLASESEALLARFFEVLDAEDFTHLLRIAGRAVDVAQMRDDRDLWAYLTNLGALYSHLMLQHRALRQLERAQYELGVALRDASDDGSRERLEDHRSLLDLLRAECHSLLGRHAEALTVGERARRAYAESRDRRGLASAVGYLADFHARYGGHADALRLNREARELLTGDDAETRQERLRIRVNEGHALQELGRLEEAQDLLEEVVPQLETLASGRGLAVALLNRGEIHEKQAAWDAARGCYEQVLAVEGLDPWLRAYAHVRQGDAEARRGSATDAKALARAESAYVAAANLLAVEADPGLHLLAHLGRGEVALARGEGETALGHVREAVRRLEGLTGGLADGEARTARSHADRQRLFRLAARAARASGDTASEFEMCERSRGRAFLAAIGGRGAAREALLDAKAQRRLERAAERLTAAYASQRAAFASGLRRRQRAAQDALREAQIAHDRTVRSIERESRRFLDLARPPLPQLSRVQEALGDADALVLYTLLEPRSRALVVRRGEVRGVDLPARGVLIEACAELDVEGADDEAEVHARLRALGRSLVDALELPASTTRLLVSPDGILAHVPWSLLPARRPEHPLEVVLVPSAATWLLLHERVDGAGERMLAVGDPVYADVHDEHVLSVYAGGRALQPLPASGEEVLAITTDADVRLLRNDATEAAFERELANRERWRVVHVAAHCVLDEAEPSLSALALTPARPDDGFLTALEVSSLDVPTDLAVLSGCETGRDPSVTGEGLSGLARAFLLAGASRVLVSQWAVDDEATRHFMTAFHREWAKPGVDAPTALRRARASTQNAWSHPRFWGAWVLWGRSD